MPQITLVLGPAGFAVVAAAGLAAFAMYLGAAEVSVLAGAALTVGAWAVSVFALLIAGCGTPAGRVDDWMWTLGIAASVAGALWALHRPSRAWWGLPAATLAATALVIVLAVALHGNTGLCPD